MRQHEFATCTQLSKLKRALNTAWTCFFRTPNMNRILRVNRICLFLSPIVSSFCQKMLVPLPVSPRSHREPLTVSTVKASGCALRASDCSAEWWSYVSNNPKPDPKPQIPDRVGRGSMQLRTYFQVELQKGSQLQNASEGFRVWGLRWGYLNPKSM